MSFPQSKISLSDFEALLTENPSRLYELVGGLIGEKMPTERHGELAGIIFSVIHAYLKSQAERIGRVAVEARYSPNNDNSLVPDVAFRYTSEKALTDGAISGVPDLAIQIKSPHDSIKRMRQKAQIYLEHGTSLVWLVYPENEIIEVYSPDSDIQILQRGAFLTGGKVLADFSISLAAIFDED